MNIPTVSIVIPAFNCENYIRECIESALKQNGIEKEVIVVDDGSTDRTPEILKGFSEIVSIHQNNQGAPSARNKGLSIARGEYVKFLDGDDYLEEGVLSKQVEYYKTLEPNEIPYGHHFVFYQRSIRLKKLIVREQTTQYETELSGLIDRNIFTSLPLYKKSALDDVNGFDLNLSSSQEWNLNIKLATLGYKFIYKNHLCYHQRVHESLFRISNKRKNPQTELNNLYITYNKISEIANCNVLVKAAWARRIWTIGRIFAYQRDKKYSTEFFQRAIRYFGDTSFISKYPRNYVLFCKFLNPFYYDLILSFLGKLRRVYFVLNFRIWRK